MERKSVSNRGLEWENLGLYIGKPIENQEQICFSMSSSACKTLCGNDIGISSSSKFPPISASHESTKVAMDSLGKVVPFENSYEDGFSMQRTGGTVTSSGEPVIGLRLGRSKEYGSSKPSTPLKRSRASYHNIQNPCCQVEGCNLDLKSAKDYHRRHRICEIHSKSPKVTVAGMERRFCQQCSRFHELSEFDDKKRSCRRRLSDHNARRRRVQPESIQLSSPGLSSALYSDQRLHQNILLNGLPIPQAGGFDANMCFSSDEIHNLDSTRNILDQYHMLSAHSLLSSHTWSLSESESSGFVNGNYYPTMRTLDSESHRISSLFQSHNASVVNSVNVRNPVTRNHPLFDSGGFYSG